MGNLTTPTSAQKLQSALHAKAKEEPGYGQWLTCASCHGPLGRGGSHMMHIWTMTAPDIRYVALRNMPEMKGRQRAYDLVDLRNTVSKVGIRMAKYPGAHLSRALPDTPAELAANADPHRHRVGARQLA